MGEVVQVKRIPSCADSQFAVAQGMDHEQAFHWWVKHVLKKKDKMIASTRKWQTRYLQKSHTFGIELPKTVIQAQALDAKNGNTLWADALSKEREKSEWHLKS